MTIPPLVALEIGTSKVVAVVGEVKPDGSLLITGVGREDSKGVRKGEIVDFDTALACVKSVLIRAEENAQVEIGSVLLAVSGGHLQSLVNQGSKTIGGKNAEIVLGQGSSKTTIDKSSNVINDVVPGLNMTLNAADGLLVFVVTLQFEIFAHFHAAERFGCRAFKPDQYLRAAGQTHFFEQRRVFVNR